MKKFIKAIFIIALIAVLCTAFSACSPSENNANTSGLDGHQSAEVCNHTFGEVETKIVGTETDCVNQVRKCSACSFEEVVEKGEHVYEEVEIAENSATYKCTICNHTYTALVENSDINSDIDDESSNESSDPESSDTSNDESGDESDESSDVESIPEDNITSTDHEFEYITKTEVAPTCTKDGYYIWECSCGDTKTEASGKKATGHKYGSWTTTKAATCTANGTQTRKCSACSKTESKSIAATGHSWDSGKVTTISGSGCSAVGTKTYTCTKCKTTKVEQMEGNHTYGEAFYEDWQQMHDIGYGQFKTTFRAKYQKCTKCGYKKTTVAAHECVLDAFVLDHTKVVRTATCTVKEKKRTTCPTCAYYWEWETDYAAHNTKSTKKHLTDYTQYTNELDVVILECNNCDFVECQYTRGKGFTTIEPQSGIKWSFHYGDADAGGAWDCSGDIHTTTFLEHPDWQVVLRDIKYDSKGCISQLTIHWVDANGRRYSDTLIVSEIPNMAKSAGLSIDEFKTSEGYRGTFSLVLSYGVIRVDGIGFTG